MVSTKNNLKYLVLCGLYALDAGAFGAGDTEGAFGAGDTEGAFGAGDTEGAFGLCAFNDGGEG